ncbi:MAG: serine/threonine protein kinase, partial [Oscillospiraceae bacterium]
MLEIGSLVDGKYRILQKIGQGGMSVVYLARNERANKQWAIKEVRKDGVQDYEVVKQNLVAETDMLKKLSHPHLPSIIDVIDGDGYFLIVMDYIEGNPLDKAIAATGAQSQANVIEWAKQLCDVLGYLHSRQPPIIYRDMKPSNVMLRPDGSVALIDFGTAREYKNNSVADTTCLGTRGYAAPEQYGGHGQTDARTDIFCLGATLYHLVTGHHPLEYPLNKMIPIRQWDPSLSGGLEYIILKCTQENADARYQSCAELYYDLEHYEDLDPVNQSSFRIKWRLFLTSCILTVVMALSSVGFLLARNNVSADTYASYIKEAKKEDSDFEDRCESFADAVNLSPDKSEAYMQLLKFFESSSSDGGNAFTNEEHSFIVKKVLEHSNPNFSGKKNIEIFEKENPEEYATFAYELGNSYYFRFVSEDGDITSKTRRAKQWYDNALETEKLEGTYKDRAETLSAMAENLGYLGQTDVDGSELMSYREYWQNIEKLLDSTESDNVQIKLEMYKYALNEIVRSSGQFIDDAISVERMNKVIDRAEALTQASSTASFVQK